MKRSLTGPVKMMPVSNNHDDSGILNFRPKARLLHLLGNELITDEVIAVVELVKNSYDADATDVSVSLKNVTKTDRGVIEIRDNGHGMTLDVLREAWMIPGKSSKEASGDFVKLTSRFERVPLGEKGVGRFSTDKLGLNLELISRACEFDPVTKEPISISSDEVVLCIDGKQYSQDLFLDEVECFWTVRSPEEFSGNSYGTLIRISNLTKTWTTTNIRKVHLGLSRLYNPFENSSNFSVKFKTNEIRDLSEKIGNPLLDKAPWALDAVVDNDGVMHYSIKIDKKEEKSIIDLRQNTKRFNMPGKKANFRNPACGPFVLKLFAFERDRKKNNNWPMSNDERKLLTDLCGVSIFRDGFRVWPYGEPGNDWILLDKRRVQRPGPRLGNDRIIGYVGITKKGNRTLRDKTNREGLIEADDSFDDLRELVSMAVDLLGNERHTYMADMEKKAETNLIQADNNLQEGSTIIGQTADKMARLIDLIQIQLKTGNVAECEKYLSELRADAEKNAEAAKAIREGREGLLGEIKLTEEHIDNLIVLSGIGLAAERMTHELLKAANLSKKGVTEAEKHLALTTAANPEIQLLLNTASSQLDIVIDAMEQLEPLYYSRRKLTEKLSVAEIARKVGKVLKNAMDELEIELNVEEESELIVEMNKGHLMQVFNNLFDNSMYWVPQVHPGQKGKIVVRVTDHGIIFADNGPGLSPNIEEHLFMPFLSTKPDGRGLGLYITKDILGKYNSDIKVLKEGKMLEGANFLITFNKEE